MTNDTAKGEHNGWRLFKHEGVPGLDSPNLPYWYATRDGKRLVSHSTKRHLIEQIELTSRQTRATDEWRRAVARMLIP